MGKITRGWRMMRDDQEADSTTRGGGRQCKTIDVIAYNVTYYIATIACNTAQHSCDRMQ
jgi:hypothetical protein